MYLFFFQVCKFAFKITGNFDEETGGRIPVIFAWKNHEEKEVWFRDMNHVIHGSLRFNQKNVGWTLLPQEKEGFTQLFCHLDSNNDGFISLEEFSDSIKEYNIKTDLITKIWFKI